MLDSKHGKKVLSLPTHYFPFKPATDFKNCFECFYLKFQGYVGFFYPMECSVWNILLFDLLHQ